MRTVSVVINTKTVEWPGWFVLGIWPIVARELLAFSRNHDSDADKTAHKNV